MTWHRIQTMLAFLITALILCALVALNYYQNAILGYVPNFPLFILPFASVGIILVVFFVLWQNNVENERSKDEFITIVTHKFRTPLTGIKWAIEMLHNNITYQQKDEVLSNMENSNQRLMEIVDLMVGFAQFDKSMSYAYEATSLREIVD